ncbi:MAG: hypothetical protein JXA33_11925 [Anaerolineae bacterium]|nr:hypothetical protein [Anaerolineae bacterium]
MRYYIEILRFQDGVRSQHPSPEAMVNLPPLGVSPDAGECIVVLADLRPAFAHRSRELRAIVVDMYWHSSGSIVARLRRSLAEANRYLVRENVKALPGHKTTGSLTCIVFSGEDIFLGQVGAAHAMVLHSDGELEVFPRRDRLLIPLAGSVPPVIHIGYAMVEEGSTLLLATTPVAEVLTRDRWYETLSLVPSLPAEAAPMLPSTAVIASKTVAATVMAAAERPMWGEMFAQVLQTMADSMASGSLILVRTLTEQKTMAEARAEPRGIAALRARWFNKPGGEPRGEGTEQKPPQRARWWEPVAQRAREDVVTPAAPGLSALEPVGESELPVGTAQPDITALSDAQKTEAALPRFKVASIRAWLEQRRLFKLHRSESRSQEAQRKVELTRVRESLRALLPGQVDSMPQPKERSVPEERMTITGGLALGILLVVAFITLTVYFQFGGTARAEEMLTDANAARGVAYNSQDPQDWRYLLTLTEQVITLDPQNADAIQLRDEAQLAIDALENAAVLESHLLLDLGMAPVPRRLIVAGGWVYVLNTSTDEVIGLPLLEDGMTPATAAPTPILKRGQAFYGETVNHLVDLAWIEPGGNYPDGAVFIYSEGGNVYIYEPTLGPASITRQRVLGDLGTGVVTLMETFGDRFYLVQRQQNQIFTYESLNGIYENPRAYFAVGTAPGLQQALDLAIDGRVYLLMGDGKVRTYFAGTEDPSFEIKGLPDPDLHPMVLTMEPDPEQGLIYLGDPKRERIVVLNKRGDFMHQFRLPGEELMQLEALAIYENPSVLYLIAANRLYAAPLPAFVTR